MIKGANDGRRERETAGGAGTADLMTHDPTAIVRAALEAAADSLIETSVWCDSQERADASWHNGVVDARKHHMRRILAIDPSTVLSKLEEPWQDIATAPPERIWVDIDETRAVSEADEHRRME